MTADAFTPDDWTSPGPGDIPRIDWMKVSELRDRFSHMGKYWKMYGVSADGREWYTVGLYVEDELKIIEVPWPATKSDASAPAS